MDDSDDAPLLPLGNLLLTLTLLSSSHFPSIPPSPPPLFPSLLLSRDKEPMKEEKEKEKERKEEKEKKDEKDRKGSLRGGSTKPRSSSSSSRRPTAAEVFGLGTDEKEEKEGKEKVEGKKERPLLQKRSSERTLTSPKLGTDTADLPGLSLPLSGGGGSGGGGEVSSRSGQLNREKGRSEDDISPPIGRIKDTEKKTRRRSMSAVPHKTDYSGSSDRHISSDPSLSAVISPRGDDLQTVTAPEKASLAVPGEGTSYNSTQSTKKLSRKFSIETAAAPSGGRSPLKRSVSISKKSQTIISRIFGFKKKDKVKKESSLDITGIGTYPSEFHLKVRKLEIKGYNLQKEDQVYFLWAGKQYGKVAASKGKELEGQVSFNFVVDISTEIIGDLAKQTFIDKKLLLTFYIARNTSSDDNPSSTPVATPKEGGGPSPNLNRNVFNADFKFGTVAIDLVDFLSQESNKAVLEKKSCVSGFRFGAVTLTDGVSELSGSLKFSVESMRGEKSDKVSRDVLNSRQIEYKSTVDPEIVRQNDELRKKISDLKKKIKSKKSELSASKSNEADSLTALKSLEIELNELNHQKAELHSVAIDETELTASLPNLSDSDLSLEDSESAAMSSSSSSSVSILGGSSSEVIVEVLDITFGEIQGKLQTMMELFEARFANNLDRIQRLATNIQTVERMKLLDKRDDLAALHSQVTELKKEVEEEKLRTELQVKAKEADLKKELDSKMAQLLLENSEQKQELDSKMALLKKSASEAQDLKAAKDKLTAEVLSLKSPSLTSTPNGSSSNSDGKVKELSDKVTELGKTVKDLTTKNQKLTADLQSSQLNESYLKETVEELQSLSSPSSSSRSPSNKQKEKEKEKEREREKEVAELKTALKALEPLKSENSKLVAELKIQKEKEMEKEKEKEKEKEMVHKEKEQLFQEKETTIRALTAEKETLTAELSSLKVSLSNSITEKEREKEVESLQISLKEMDKKVEEKEKEKEALQAAFQKENEAFSSQLAASLNEITVLKQSNSAEIDSLKKEIATKEANEKEKEKEREMEKVSVQQTLAQKDDLLSQNRDLSAQLTSLKSQIQENEAAVKTLMAEKGNLETVLKTEKVENEALLIEVEKLTRENKQFQEMEKVFAEKEKHFLEKEKAFLEKGSAFSEENKSNQGNIEFLELEVQLLKNEITDKSNEVAEKAAKKEADAKTSLVIELESAIQESHKLNSDISRKENELSSISEKLSLAESQLRSLSEEKAHHEATLSAMETSHAEELSKLGNELSQLREQYEELEELHSEKDDSIAELNELRNFDIQKYETLLVQKTEELSLKEEELKVKEEEVKKEKKEKEALTAASEMKVKGMTQLLENSLQKMQMTSADLAKKQEALVKANSEKDSEISELKKVNSELSDVLTSKMEETEGLKVEKTVASIALREELSKLTTDSAQKNAEYIAQIANLSNAVTTSDEKLKEISKELEIAKENVKEKEKEMDKELEAKRSEIAALKAELVSQSEKLRREEEEKQKSQLRSESLMSEFTQFREEAHKKDEDALLKVNHLTFVNSQFQEKSSELRNELDKLNSEKHALEIQNSELEVLRRAKEEKEMEVSLEKEEKETLQEAVATVSSDLQSALKEKEDLKTQFQELKSNMEDIKRDKQEKEKEVEKEKEQITSLQQALATVSSELEGALKEKKDFTLQFQELHSKLESVEKEKEEKEKEVEKEMKVKETLHKAVESVSIELQSALKEKKEVEVQLREVQSTHSEHTTKLSNEIAELAKEKTVLQSEAADSKKESERVKEGLEILKKELAAASENLSNLGKENSELKTNMVSEKEIFLKFEEKVSVLEKEKAALNEQVGRAEKTVADRIHEITALKASISDEKLRSDALALQNEELKKAVEVSNSEVSASLETAAKEKKVFEAQLVTFQSELGVKAEELSKLGNASSEKDRALSSLMQELKGLKDKNSLLEDLVDKLKKEGEEKQREVDEKEKEREKEKKEKEREEKEKEEKEKDEKVEKEKKLRGFESEVTSLRANNLELAKAVTEWKVLKAESDKKVEEKDEEVKKEKKEKEKERKEKEKLSADLKIQLEKDTEKETALTTIQAELGALKANLSEGEAVAQSHSLKLETDLKETDKKHKALEVEFQELLSSHEDSENQIVKLRREVEALRSEQETVEEEKLKAEAEKDKLQKETVVLSGKISEVLQAKADSDKDLSRKVLDLEMEKNSLLKVVDNFKAQKQQIASIKEEFGKKMTQMKDSLVLDHENQMKQVFAVKAALEKRIEEMQFEVAERSRLLMLSQAELTLAKRQLEQQLHISVEERFELEDRLEENELLNETLHAFTSEIARLSGVSVSQIRDPIYEHHNSDKSQKTPVLTPLMTPRNSTEASVASPKALSLSILSRLPNKESGSEMPIRDEITALPISTLRSSASSLLSPRSPRVTAPKSPRRTVANSSSHIPLSNTNSESQISNISKSDGLTSNSSTTVDSPISESSKEKAFLVDSFEIHDDYVEEKGKGKMTMDEKKDEEEEKERGGEEVVSSSASSYAIAIPSRQDEDAPATLPPSSLSSSFLSESLSSASLLSSSPSVHEGESPISTYAKTRVRKITNRRTQLKLPHLEKEKEHDLLSSPLNSVKTTSPIAAFSEMRTAEEEKEKEKGKETETEVKEAGVASLAPSENVTSFSKDLMSQISNSEGPSAVVNLASPALGASELVELHSPEYYSEVLSLILAKFKSTFQESEDRAKELRMLQEALEIAKKDSASLPALQLELTKLQSNYEILSSSKKESAAVIESLKADVALLKGEVEMKEKEVQAKQDEVEKKEKEVNEKAEKELAQLKDELTRLQALLKQNADVIARREELLEAVQDVEPLRQLMFHYMAIAVKLSAASDGKNVNIDTRALYNRIEQESIHFAKWPELIRTEIDMQSAGANISPLNSSRGERAPTDTIITEKKQSKSIFSWLTGK